MVDFNGKFLFPRPGYGLIKFVNNGKASSATMKKRTVFKIFTYR